jgi:hypothetical protein
MHLLTRAAPPSAPLWNSRGARSQLRAAGIESTLRHLAEFGGGAGPGGGVDWGCGEGGEGACAESARGDGACRRGGRVGSAPVGPHGLGKTQCRTCCLFAFCALHSCCDVTLEYLHLGLFVVSA